MSDCRFGVSPVNYPDPEQIGPFSLFQMKNDISQSLGLDLVNINVYAKVYQNIPLNSRDRAIFTFSEFGARQSLDQ